MAAVSEKKSSDAALMKTGGDRRVRKTMSALKNALIKLLKEKNINNISVKELTDLADINRGTFYLHYRDVSDLMNQLEDDILEQLKATVDQFSDDVITTNPQSLFSGLYSLCLMNAELCSILLSENGDIRFLNMIKQLMREKCLNDWFSKLRKSRQEHFDAYYAFILGGCLSLLQYWFASGMAESPDELAEITSVFINNTINT